MFVVVFSFRAASLAGLVWCAKKEKQAGHAACKLQRVNFPVASTCKLVASGCSCIIADKLPAGLSQSPNWLTDELRANVDGPWNFGSPLKVSSYC